MKILSLLSLLAGVVAVSEAATTSACKAGNCRNQVANTGKPGAADCSSYFVMTIALSTTTVTSVVGSTVDYTVTNTRTIKASTTTSTTSTSVQPTSPYVSTYSYSPPQKRDATKTIPTYASACSNEALYSSACSCIGVTAGSTTVTVLTTTVVSTGTGKGTTTTTTYRPTSTSTISTTITPCVSPHLYNSLGYRRSADRVGQGFFSYNETGFEDCCARCYHTPNCAYWQIHRADADGSNYDGTPAYCELTVFTTSVNMNVSPLCPLGVDYKHVQRGNISDPAVINGLGTGPCFGLPP